MYLQEFFDRKFLADLDQKLSVLKNVNIFEFCSDLVLEVRVNISLTQVPSTQSRMYLQVVFDRKLLAVLNQKLSILKNLWS